MRPQCAHCSLHPTTQRLAQLEVMHDHSKYGLVHRILRIQSCETCNWQFDWTSCLSSHSRSFPRLQQASLTADGAMNHCACYHKPQDWSPGDISWLSPCEGSKRQPAAKGARPKWTLHPLYSRPPRRANHGQLFFKKFLGLSKIQSAIICPLWHKLLIAWTISAQNLERSTPSEGNLINLESENCKTITLWKKDSLI